MDSIIVWNPDPELIRVGVVAIRWYGLFFAFAFLSGTIIMTRIVKLENKSERSVDRLLIYMLVAIVIGARLGEILFYNLDYYLSHPGEIIKIWRGGLASHGAVVGILIALFIYSRKTPDQPYLWILDRIVIIVAFGGTLIRIGNFLNSEILGAPTNADWGIVFSRVDSIPRHPAQLYESAVYFVLFVVLWFIYKRSNYSPKPGLLFGVFLTIAFTARFLIEFVKRNQVAFEDGWLFNMGQLLSIPVVFLGLVILVRASAGSNRHRE